MEPPGGIIGSITINIRFLTSHYCNARKIYPTVRRIIVTFRLQLSFINFFPEDFLWPAPRPGKPVHGFQVEEKCPFRR